MMDQIFKEEQAKLDEVERRIDAEVDNYKNLHDKLDAEISYAVGHETEDYYIRRDLIQRKLKASEMIRELLAFKPSPYFGRIDLYGENDTANETGIHYIGKEGLDINAKAIVVDWRTPVGQCFYATNQTTYKIKGITYSLALRRELEIQNEKLVSCQTTYDGGVVSLEGDVIDPFLLTVLKDKRRQHRLTDIIRSIQANQNDIIRRPLRESFIVQGCAGSGKTMILLHRLSYLKFNHREMPLSRVKIVTPNPDFNTHINDLSTELDIDTIQNLTVEEYYVDLIGRFSGTPIVSSKVLSECRLKPELLGEIYSEGFKAQLQEQYRSHWAAVLNALNENQLKNSFALHHIKYPITAAYNEETAAAFSDGIKRIIKEHLEVIEKKEAAEKRKIALEEAYAAAEEVHKKTEEEARLIRQDLIENLKTRLSDVQSQMLQIGETIQLSRNRQQKLLKIASEDIRRTEAELKYVRQTYQDIDFDTFVEDKETLSRDIGAALKEQIATIHTLQEQIQHTPNYSFVKRNALLRQQKEAKERFAQDAKRYIDSWIAEKEEALSKLKSAVASHREEQLKLSHEIDAWNDEIKQLQTTQTALEECVSGLTSSDEFRMPFLSKNTKDKLKAELADYQQIIANLKRQERNKLDIQKAILTVEADIRPPYEEDIEYLKTCQTEIKKLEYNEIFRQVISDPLEKLYAKYEVKDTRKNNRHKLYLSLLLCSWYYKRLVSPDTYLNIDEAQDISIAEYTMLREILGEDCVFNLYGDINQSLFPEKSIMDWEDLRDIVGDKVFVLNEDYRNTLQITEYCNQAFSAEIYPIGITGEEVYEMDTKQAIQWLMEIKHTNPTYRTAVILHEEKASKKKELSEMFGEEKISWYAVDDKRISVLSVENAKGLEFEAVVVLSDGMEMNELYIAYTRALDYLCVVK